MDYEELPKEIISPFTGDKMKLMPKNHINNANLVIASCGYYDEDGNVDEYDDEMSYTGDVAIYESKAGENLYKGF